MATSKVAFLGLGVMGSPMAGHGRAGHAVAVYNRTGAKAAQWVEKKNLSRCRPPQRRAPASRGQRRRARCRARRHGALSTMKAGTILVDHTTASASVAREVHAAANAKGVRFLDAPVSGGQAGAENGKLTIMVGGEADAFAVAEPVLATYAEGGDAHGRPAHQDGQPDLHRRPGAGSVRGAEFCRASRT